MVFVVDVSWPATVDPEHLPIENNGLQDQNSQGLMAKPRKDV